MKSVSKSDDLLKWFCQHDGYLNGSIELVHSAEHGYHYMTKTRPIKPNESICRCPFALTLSYLNILPVPPVGIRNCTAESVCRQLFDNPDIERNTISIFFLAEQRLKGRDSFWYPYIQLLPTEAEMTTPLWYEDGDLSYLKGTNLLLNNVHYEDTLLGQQEARYQKQWKVGVESFKDSNELVLGMTWKLFLWAATIYSSRGFTSDLFTTQRSTTTSFSVLYPILDIFNHDPDAKVKWDLSKGDFSLALEESVDLGKQIFNNYSPKSNEDLLMGFGFCIPDNSHDRVAVRLGQVHPKVHDKLRVKIPNHWQSEAWEERESVFYLQYASCYSESYSFSNDIPQSIRLQRIPPELAKTLYTIVRAHTGHLMPSECIQNKRQCWEIVVGLLLDQMETARTDIVQWNTKIAAHPITAQVTAASIYRKGQIKILEAVIRDLKALPS